MKRFNYPTTVLYGPGALEEFADLFAAAQLKRPLLVTDKTLVELGLADKVQNLLKREGCEVVLFDGTQPNPTEEDVEKGAELLKSKSCDSVIALGGGSPMDAAKVIVIKATQDGDLVQYDDAKGGDKLIDAKKMLPIYAIPTTAGTGSEVGRCGVIIMRESNDKTIFFHPLLMPVMAVLEPELTKGLPAGVTAATGIDAFTHSLEAYFAPGFDPMADGIALESLRLVLKNLKTCVENGSNVEARAQMQMAALMGATAFQKGLGMIHSMAHPLSSECGLHHGLANALLLPASVAFLEAAPLNAEMKQRLEKVNDLFEEFGFKEDSLSKNAREFFSSVGIEFGLRNHGVKEEDIEVLVPKAQADVCHQTNMIPVSSEDMRQVYQEAFQ